MNIADILARIPAKQPIAETADLLGVSWPTAQAWILGRRVPTLGHSHAIAHVTGVPHAEVAAAIRGARAAGKQA